MPDEVNEVIKVIDNLSFGMRGIEENDIVDLDILDVASRK